MGYCVLLATILGMARQKVPALTYIGVLLLLAFLSGRSVVRNQEWKSDFTLHEAGVKSSPNNIKLVSNYGLLLLDRAQAQEYSVEERKKYFIQAEEVLTHAHDNVVGNTHFPSLYFTFGNLMHTKGEKHWERALQL